MNRSSDSDTPDDFVAHVLGQGTAAERASTQDRVDRDLEAALEVAELRDLFEGMRELSVEPTGQVGLSIRHAVRRRSRRLHGSESVLSWPGVSRVAQVAGIAAVALVSLILIDRSSRRAQARTEICSWDELFALPVAGDFEQVPAPVAPRRLDRELAQMLTTSRLPVESAAFRTALEALASRPLSDSFRDRADALAELRAMRAQFQLRVSERDRQHALRSIGAPDFQDRLDVLAAAIATQLERDLERGAEAEGSRTLDASTADLAMGLRALLAAGSSWEHGPHQATVQAVALELVHHRLSASAAPSSSSSNPASNPALDSGGDWRQPVDDAVRATALAALCELAVDEGALRDVVALHVDQLARRTLRGDLEKPGSRPALLHWQASVDQLADAGRVLRLAPAFGVHPGLAFRARMLIAAHLEERLQGRSGREAPALVAAQLYGFGDIIDRDVAERALRLWRPELLMPNFVALHHIAWSKSPTRVGWADFQQELRGLSGVSTPASTRQAAALLLCLATNGASPGSAVALLD